MNRVEAEVVLRALTAGANPQVGDTIIFTEKGWEFQEANSSESHNHDDRYYTKDEADARFAPIV